jgi:PAS domain-containing protein
MRRTHTRANRAPSTGSDARPSGSADPAARAGAGQSSANERFRMLFDRASVGIISLGSDGRPLEANPAVERMLGYSAGELTSMCVKAFTHGCPRRCRSSATAPASRASAF